MAEVSHHANSEKNKIDDHNMKQFNRYTKSDGERDAQKIYLTTFAGELATISRDDSRSAGYPMGSVVPFVIDHTGSPVIHTANVAEHTKNALANGKASLLVREVSKNHNIETGWRLVSMGDLEKVDGPDHERVAKTYFRHYPGAKAYDSVHDFYFFRLNIKVARVIMGFGLISWVDAEALCRPSPFDEETEDRMIKHMNEDHVDAMKTYLAQHKVEVSEAAAPPEMVAINQFGATVRYRKRLYFVAFETEANDANAAREQLVLLAKK